MPYLEREVIFNDLVLGTFTGVLFDLCHQLLPKVSYLGFLAGWRNGLDPSILGLPVEVGIALNIRGHRSAWMSSRYMRVCEAVTHDSEISQIGNQTANHQVCELPRGTQIILLQLVTDRLDGTAISGWDWRCSHDVRGGRRSPGVGGSPRRQSRKTEHRSKTELEVSRKEVVTQVCHSLALR